MRNQRYQNDYDEWDYDDSNDQYYSKPSRSERDSNSINYCPRCGEPIDIHRKLQFPRRRQNQEMRKYNQSYNSNSSIGSVVLGIIMIIAIIGILASCNVSNTAAKPETLPAQSVSAYDNNISISKTEVAALTYNEELSPAVISVQEEANPPEPVSGTYEVKAGDTLYHIAVEMLGDGSRWVEIDQLNNLVRLPSGSVIIHPGQVLVMPNP